MLIVIALTAVAAVHATEAQPSQGEALVSAATSGLDMPDPLVPSYSFDWHGVRDAVDPVVYQFTQTPWGTCLGHLSTHIGFGAQESGVRSLTSEPIEGQRCTYQIRATQGGTHSEARPTSQDDEHTGTHGTVQARLLDADGSLRDEPPWAADPSYEPYGPRHQEERREAYEDNIRAQWALWNELKLDPAVLLAR